MKLRFRCTRTSEEPCQGEGTRHVAEFALVSQHQAHAQYFRRVGRSELRIENLSAQYFRAGQYYELEFSSPPPAALARDYRDELIR